MGGTGGPMDPRAGAQAGLTGAGLLASEQGAPSAKLAALGIEGAPQPTTTQLAGRTTPSEIPVPTSASDTPVTPAVDTPVPAAAVATPATATATAPAFQLAGSTNLGFPSADMPLGTVSHVPFGTAAPTVSAPTVSAAAPIVSAPAAAAVAQGPMHQTWPPPGSGGQTTAQWLAANPNWQQEFNRSEQRADGSWWAPDDPAASLGGKYFNDGKGGVVYQYSPAATGR